MAPIEVDDELYLRALKYLGGRTALGVIEGFHGFLDIARVTDQASRHAALDGLLLMMGDDEGDYTELGRSGDSAAELRRVVWSYHRAWVDRFGFVGSISQSS